MARWRRVRPCSSLVSTSAPADNICLATVNCLVQRASPRGVSEFASGRDMFSPIWSLPELAVCIQKQNVVNSDKSYIPKLH